MRSIGPLRLMSFSTAVVKASNRWLVVDCDSSTIDSVSQLDVAFARRPIRLTIGLGSRMAATIAGNA